MLDWAADAGWGEVLAVGVLLNLATTGTSAGLWRALVARRGVGGEVRPVDRRDVVLAASTTAVNAVALLPPWWLWREGHITISGELRPVALLEVGYLLVGVDTVMYWLHRFFHGPRAYRLAHVVHHGGDPRMSALTLFVMHPLEAAGFSVAVLGLLWLVPVSLPAIGAFFLVNLVIGTVAHVPRASGRATSRWDRAVGGSWLHQGHHDDEGRGFGFFTGFWDAVAGTRPGTRPDGWRA